MIHRVVFHNDRLLPIEEVRLSPGQSGLMSGWGLFTTMRVVEGIPFAFERHWKRLSRDAQRTHCPFPFSEETVHGQLSEVLRANQVKEGCARIYMIYNQFGFWRSDENLPAADLVICSADLPPHREQVRLALREHGRHAASPLAGVKVTSWLNNVWNLYEAQQGGLRRSRAAQRARRSGGMHGREYLLRPRRPRVDAAAFVGLPGRRDARRRARDRRAGGRAGGGTDADAGRSLFRG